MTATIQRVRVRVEGGVQGVGFRPYVHRLAADPGYGQAAVAAAR